MHPTRRRLITGSIAGALLLPAMLRRAAAQAPAALTPSCGPGAAQTQAQTEGPFFKPNTPERRDFTADVPRGDKIVIAGYVVDSACRPLPGSLVEVWQADEQGRYDTSGFRLRGHQLTDMEGRWWLSTIVPAAYPGRTRHYHVKVQRPGGRLLTTQLYFPGDPENRRDGLFSEKLQLAMSDSAAGRVGRFDFVVA